MKMKDLVFKTLPKKQKKMKIIITENQVKMIFEKMQIKDFKPKEYNKNETNQR